MLRSRFTILPLAVALATAACGGASATPLAPSAAPSAAPSSVPATAIPATGQSVILSEWKVAVAGTIKAGAVVFTITNAGTVPHELLVFTTNVAPSAYPTDSAGDIDEEQGPPMSDGENVEPGGSQTRTIDLAPGTYLFVCNIPSHYKQGMSAFVTVTP